MSLFSMTGYGRGSASGEGLTASVEISSVNRKQLDIVFSLPRGMTAMEARIADVIREGIHRGRIMVDVSIEWTGAARRKAVHIDVELAAAYVSALRGAADALGVKDDTSVQTIAALPDVLHFARPQEDIEQVWRIARKALQKALTDLNTMRRREGQALQRDLQGRLHDLRETLAMIRKQVPNVVAHYRDGLRERIASAGVDLAGADDRLLREIALFADRSDISEEITRLDSHLKQARQMTRSKTATGRSLDFLAQEMFREINTIGSKANDTQILQHGVAFKTELERIREQVQNVE